MMNTEQEKAFDLASETTKQIIGLSTAIIALTVTFSKDVLGAPSAPSRIPLVIAWILLLISIVFGIMTMMAMAGTLDPMPPQVSPAVTAGSNPNTSSPSPPPPSIYGRSIRIYSGRQVFFFLLGLIAAMVFGYKSFGTKAEPAKGHKIVRQSRFGSDTTIYRDTILLPEK